MSKIMPFAEKDRAGVRVLAVDDDPLTRKMLDKVLSAEGYSVDLAENGQQALDLFEKQRYGIVLLDVMMPIMDGYTSCREMRNKVADDSLPILMLTGLNDVDSVNSAFEAGATDFVTKPISWPLLGQRVKYALRNRELFLSLRESERRLGEALSIAKMGYWQYSHVTGEMMLSHYFSKAMKRSENDKVPISEFMSHVSEENREELKSSLENSVLNKSPISMECFFSNGDGKPRCVSIVGKSVDLDGGLVVVGTMQDISEKKRAQDLIFYQTYYDTLTGLPNRMLLRQRIKRSMMEAENDYNLMALYVLSIDRFDTYVESMGHNGSDAVIKKVASKLSEIGQFNVFMSRFSSTSFALIKGGLNTVDEASAFGKTVLEHISRPFRIDEHEVQLGFSAGVSLYPMDSDNDESLMKHAEVAMRKASDGGGKQIRYYTKDMDTQAVKRIGMEAEIRQGLERGEFIVFYQPQVEIRTGEVVGMEALVRWQHPVKGLIPPFQFIPVAEESGLIVPIGADVIRQACAQMVAWDKQGLGRFRVGVNFSAKQFIHDDVVSLIKQALMESGIAPECLDVEITESVAMTDLSQSIKLLNTIRELGVKTSMDDFGTGFSSLSSLQKLPIDTLKIDRAFVKDIKANGENSAFSKAVAAMASSLGMHVIAEGVEEKHQLDVLSKFEVDEIQGFYFSQPLAADKMAEFLHSFRRKKAS